MKICVIDQIVNKVQNFFNYQNTFLNAIFVCKYIQYIAWKYIHTPGQRFEVRETILYFYNTFHIDNKKCFFTKSTY